jgi:hypothetical protein
MLRENPRRCRQPAGVPDAETAELSALRERPSAAWRLPACRQHFLRKGFDMSGLMAGYAVAIVAMLIAASAALAIIRGFGGLASTEEKPAREEQRPTKAAA